MTAEELNQMLVLQCPECGLFYKGKESGQKAVCVCKFKFVDLITE